MTDRIHRRAFLDQSKQAGLGLAAGVTILGDPRSARAAPAADKIVMGIVGCRGRGPGLVHGFLDRGDCEFAYLADVNKKQYSYADVFAKRQGGRRPKCVQDFRRVLEEYERLAADKLGADPYNATVATKRSMETVEP